MWPRHAHILAPLTTLTGTNKFKQELEHKKALKKKMITTDALIAYPDHNLPFHIYTDASDTQLGSVIMQNEQPIAYYTKKLNPAQCNYMTIEK